MKFSQLIEHNMKSIFSKNHTQNVMDKLVPDPLIKKSKFSIYLDHQLQILSSLFFYWSTSRTTKTY